MHRCFPVYLVLVLLGAAPGRPATEGKEATRLRVALAQAKAGKAEAVPVLIDLLAVLDAKQRQPIEELLKDLAGEWAPSPPLQGDDVISRRVRREAWAGWWRSTDGPALLAILRDHSGSAEKEARIRKLIGKLGSDSFPEREQASTDLTAFGTLALPLLRESRKHPDPEIARRVEACIRRIERAPAYHLPLAAFRLLGLRRPQGATAALLDYLPFAEGESCFVAAQQALTALARSEGKADATLVKALESPSVIRRAAAAEALARGGGMEIRPAVRKLLADANPEVRLRVARALLAVQERAAVPVLIDLLTVLPPDRVEEALLPLNELAGDRAPPPPEGEDRIAHAKHRAAWAAWWKTNAARIDLAKQGHGKTLLGFTLIVNEAGTVTELDRDNRPRWTINELRGPVDAWGLPGNRVLICEFDGLRVTERDHTGKILWQKTGLTNHPLAAQRLANGHTFIATRARILEVDQKGKEVFSLTPMGQIEAAQRMSNGEIVYLRGDGKCVFLAPDGKERKSFVSGRIPGDQLGGLALLPSGHVLIAQMQRNKIVELDSQGRSVREIEAPRVTTVTALPNGHLLAASYGLNRAVEMDLKGKVIREYKGNRTYRARRR